MTHEEFQEQLHNMSDRKIIELSTIWVDEMCRKGGDRFTMSIPPKLNDTDVILSELIRRFESKVILK